MKSDEQLKQDVLDEFRWDPAIDAGDIEVSVHQGVVTINGTVSSCTQKLAARKAVQRVAGGKALVIELGVRAPAPDLSVDEAIAEALVAVLKWTEGLPQEGIGVEVERGCVTLTGEVEWGYQRHAAEMAVSRIRGVVGVVNRIAVCGDADPAEVSAQIAAALKRRAQAGAQSVAVEVRDGVVTLRGTVGSLAEKKVAHGAARSTPGVRSIVDQLVVA